MEYMMCRIPAVSNESACHRQAVQVEDLQAGNLLHADKILVQLQQLLSGARHKQARKAAEL